MESRSRGLLHHREDWVTGGSWIGNGPLRLLMVIAFGLLGLTLAGIGCDGDEGNVGADTGGGGVAVEESPGNYPPVPAGGGNEAPTETAIVDGVPWMPQVPPGQWANTMTCVVTSYYMVRSHLLGMSASQQDYAALVSWAAANDPLGRDWRSGNGPASGLRFDAITSWINDYDGDQVVGDVRGITVEELIEELRAGRPVVVFGKTQTGNNAPSETFSSYGTNHAMVVVGVEPGYVYINDPGRSAPDNAQYRKFTWESFYSFWGSTGGQLAVRLRRFSSPAACGDGNITGAEECDGTNLNGESCASLGYNGGTLSCSSACTFDVGGCYNVQCGNGVQEAGEECDGSDLGGVSCADLGYQSGQLGCTSQCDYDTSSCEGQLQVSIHTDPALNTWTDSFTVEPDCTCSASNSDCHALYVARVTTVIGNTANMEFQKVTGGGPSTTVSYWIAVGAETYPSCTDVGAYVVRTQGQWSSSQDVLQVPVSVWPSQADFDSAACGESKRLFIITGGGGGYENEKLWFQKQAVTFTKTCN